MTIQSIIFDLFGVVAAFDDGRVNERLARHCRSPEVALAALQNVVSSPRLITGEQSLHELHEQLCCSLGLDLPYTRFEALWREPYSSPMPGMAPVLAALQKAHPLLLLSNVDRYYWSTMKAMHPELSFFSRLLLSWELGMAKPDRRVFVHAAASAGADPSACLFIDDKLENIEAARELGFHVHHFRGVPKLSAALRQSGIAGL